MKTVKKIVAIIFVTIIALIALPFILLGYYVVPKFRRAVTKWYVKGMRESKKMIKNYVLNNGELDSVVLGVPVYIIPDCEIAEEAGGAFHATGLGIVISRSLINHPYFLGIFYHELGHALLKHKYGRGFFRVFKSELEADHFAVKQGYGEEIKKFLIENFKKDPKKNILPYLMIHFWRILALKMQGV